MKKKLKSTAIALMLMASAGAAAAEPNTEYRVSSSGVTTTTVLKSIDLVGLTPNYVYEFAFEFWYQATGSQDWSGGQVGFKLGTTEYWSNVITNNNANGVDAASVMPSGTPLMQVATDALGKAVVVIGATVFARNVDDDKFKTNTTRTIEFGPVTVSNGVPNPTVVPGPIAGAGLPILIGFAGYAAWRRRKARMAA